MQISINTSEADKDELTALIALCASLGGRLPVTGLKVGAISVTTGAEGAVVEYDQQDAENNLAGQMGESEDQQTAAHADVNMGRRGPPLGTEAPPPPPPAATGEVDSKGIPWDARIHSESKATIADGSWRKRRGVDDATYATVLAELQGAAPPPPPPAADGPNDGPPPPPPSAPAEAQSDVAAAAPAAGPNLSAFADFPAFVSAVSKHGKSYAELNELSVTVGVPAFKDMKDHGDKWDLFFSMLG